MTLFVSKGSLLRGPTEKLVSSLELAWPHVAVEHRIARPGERNETSIDCCVVEVAAGSEITYGERAMTPGKFKRYAKAPHTISVFSEGTLIPIRPDSDTEIIACALDWDLIRGVSDEHRSETSVPLAMRLGFTDHSLEALVRALLEEAKTPGGTSQLYRDHIAYAIALRLLARSSLATAPIEHSHGRADHRLGLVLDYLHENYQRDIGLAELVALSGYSRSHFLRMFRYMTKRTPYQYQLYLRIDLAKRMMSERHLQLIDISMECGFANQAHFSRLFRKIVGIPPNEYRRSRYAPH